MNEIVSTARQARQASKAKPASRKPAKADKPTEVEVEKRPPAECGERTAFEPRES